MAAYMKKDHWDEQFMHSFPMVVARFWVHRNIATIEKDFESVDAQQIMAVTEGGWSKHQLGGAMTKMFGYTRQLMSEIMSGTDFMTQFTGSVFRPDQAEDEMAHIIGELITNGVPGTYAFKTKFPEKMSEIRKEAMKYKTVKGVMSA